ncbi:hypothetical protein FRC02_002637 [Tulasnella sp. 418]|nr:hypothetical protein FRC02_002637 [Tulasnella sp. 418]
MQERLLTETEIVEMLKVAGEGRLLWSTHKPLEGWYIRLKSPLLPPHFSIPLLPYSSQSSSPNNPTFTGMEVPEGSMTFSCRTQADMSRVAVPPKKSDHEAAAAASNEHSYPPAPSPVRSLRDSISAASVSSSSRLDDTLSPIPRESSTTSSPGPSRSPSQITHFLISPHLPPTSHQNPAESSSSKIFGVIQRMFTGGVGKSFSIQTPALPPILRFHDTTPVLSVRTTGVIELDEGVARVLGVDLSFYIAMALAFLEYLSDKEAYLAASEG